MSRYTHSFELRPAGSGSGWTAWPASAAGPSRWLRCSLRPGQARDLLAELVTAATLRYLRYGNGSPVLLIHTATAPNAVLHTLPRSPRSTGSPA